MPVITWRDLQQTTAGKIKLDQLLEESKDELMNIIKTCPVAKYEGTTGQSIPLKTIIPKNSILLDCGSGQSQYECAFAVLCNIMNLLEMKSLDTMIARPYEEYN
jgi:hypothetical protein